MKLAAFALLAILSLAAATKMSGRKGNVHEIVHVYYDGHHRGHRGGHHGGHYKGHGSNKGPSKGKDADKESGKETTSEETKIVKPSGGIMFLKPLYLKSSKGSFLRALPTTQPNEVKLDMSPRSLEWEEWVLVPVSGRKVALRSYWGWFLSANTDLSLNIVNYVRTWEEWTIKVKDGKVAFQSFHNTYLGIDGAIPKLSNALTDVEYWTAIPKKE